ncbi:TonB family protein [Cobetia sp. L2A1]|uniref:TonB family protein n=1 Tax=Cobetia sp. L2A1 TaxID=2686360 RepID=UPI00131EB6ED|nr:TonB family protein [Cobetia sp. L2A1]
MAAPGGWWEPLHGVTDPITYVPVTRVHRRVVAWGAALAIHVGVGWWLLESGLLIPPQAQPLPPPVMLDVTLVSEATSAAVKSDVIAEQAQQASGSGREAIAHAGPKTPVPPQQGEAASVPAEAPQPEVTEAAMASLVLPQYIPEVITTQTDSPQQVAHSELLPDTPDREQEAREQDDVLARAQASGQTREVVGELASRKAARASARARYINDWTGTVQSFGNLHYPAPANLSGELRIRAVILPNGQLEYAEVLQSSGHAELDQAALDTVYGAAPYAPFDESLKGMSRLTITRIWRFGSGNDSGAP